ncbi:ferric reductase-like transmembrane domain-containing protein [Lapillicoccus jejuensis]|uniref:Ferric reductase like protein n=1 Tax=Lapillicoccus jejuensis TaxID=402171 RepID=A0A542DW51_9MICO|nr:ferric reductase-like transmembrane domain-containing protein [Lapillicoccus jejuensis]TQJ07134.1 ferric reductase like protein [Lapillicoccus jejuensis]
MNEILWYASRATGVASITLLTAVVVLGMLTASRRPPRGVRSAVVIGLHRSLALGASLFLLVHIATAIAETYVNIDLVSALVPFTSGYETAWVGLGTLAFDIVLALVATSLLRHRLPERAWRTVHWAAYAFWPMALIHGLALGTSSEPLLRGTTIACAVVGAAALVWRVGATDPDRERRSAVLAQEWS